MSAKGVLVVVSGPSGAGKGTLCAALMAARPSLAYSVSATTRSPRPGEVDGTDYHFTSRAEFERMIRDGELLEHAEVFGNYYGTPLARVRARLGQGRDILLEIDTRGAMQVCAGMPEAVTIFILPPSLSELERRLRARGTDSAESVARRLAEARREIAMAREYGYAVVNDTVESAVARLCAIIDAERCRTSRMDLAVN